MTNVKDIQVRADLVGKVLEKTAGGDQNPTDIARVIWKELDKQKMAGKASERTILFTGGLVALYRNTKKASSSGEFSKRLYSLEIAKLLGGVSTDTELPQGRPTKDCTYEWSMMFQSKLEYEIARQLWEACATALAGGSFRVDALDADSWYLGDSADDKGPTGNENCDSLKAALDRARNNYNMWMAVYIKCENGTL